MSVFHVTSVFQVPSSNIHIVHGLATEVFTSKKRQSLATRRSQKGLQKRQDTTHTSYKAMR